MAYRDKLEAARAENSVLKGRVEELEREWLLVLLLFTFLLALAALFVLLAGFLGDSCSNEPRSSYPPPEVTQITINERFSGRLRKAEDRGHFYEFRLPQKEFVLFDLSVPGKAGAELYARGARVPLRVISAPETSPTSLLLPAGVYRVNFFGDPAHPFEAVLRILGECNPGKKENDE